MQSKINKKLEILNTYHSYKHFLDDLRPKEVKDRAAAVKMEKLEHKMRARKANSLQDSQPHRGGRINDTSKSVQAQARNANAAHGHGKGDDGENVVQYEVEYPSKLRQLFEDDSENETYDLPFEKPEHLMAHFTELEENNLSLIQ